jgi:hypothetical protein
MHTELERSEKTIMAYFKVLSQYLPQRTEENHRKPLLGSQHPG